MLKSFARFSTPSPAISLSPFCRELRAKSKAFVESSDSSSSSRWSMVNEIESFLSGSTASPRDLSVIGWSVERMSLDDPRLWQAILDKLNGFTGASWSDIGSVMFSAARTYTREPATFPERTLGSIQNWISEYFVSQSAEPSLADLAQICYAVSIMFPKFILNKNLQKKLITVLKALPTHNEDEKIPIISSCKEICLLWSGFRIVKSQNVNVPLQLTSALLEASRGLRYCEDFNQNKASQVCDAIAALNLNDPRIVYQIILFVDKHNSEINHRNLLRIARAMSKLGVANDILWKRIAARMEDPIGLKLSVKELEELRYAFGLLKNNQRIMGILDLYIKTKVDESKYGGF